MWSPYFLKDYSIMFIKHLRKYTFFIDIGFLLESPPSPFIYGSYKEYNISTLCTYLRMSQFFYVSQIKCRSANKCKGVYHNIILPLSDKNLEQFQKPLYDIR